MKINIKSLTSRTNIWKTLDYIHIHIHITYKFKFSRDNIM